jgi:hypothetical protein
MPAVGYPTLSVVGWIRFGMMWVPSVNPPVA